MVPTPPEHEWKGQAHEGKGFILGEVVRNSAQNSRQALPPQSLPPSNMPVMVLVEQERGQGNAVPVLAP